MTRAGRAAVVSLRGEHDLSTVEHLESACEGAWGDAAGIVFDLTEATFIDSTVVGVMVRAQQRAQAQNGTIAVAAPAGGTAERVLTLVGIGDLLPVYATRDEALRAVDSTL